MFDKHALEDAVDTFLVCTRVLWAGHSTLWPEGFSLNGRGLPPNFHTVIQHKSATSGHQRFDFHDKTKMMQTALTEIRRQHRLASGGLDPKIWNVARLSVASEGDTFFYNRPTISDNQRSQNLGRSNTFVERMASHAALDLRGPLRRFRLAPMNNSALPYVVLAPTPELAIQRLSALLHNDLQRWQNPIVHEVLDPALYKAALT